MSVPRVFSLSWAVAFASAAAACANVDSSERFDLVAPTRDSFDAVAPFLVHRCGSLDCHGQVGRNLRLYGREGLRLDASAVPGEGPNSKAELDSDYRSVVGLEPEILSDVVKDGGGDPERLTMIRKARGTEDHAGGGLMQAGDSQDACITSWLAGDVDKEACAAALEFP